MEPSGEARIWLTAFWGFAPERWACVGWTKESYRTRFLQEAKDDDLVLIYGSGSKPTNIRMRRKVLGFYQIEARPVFDREWISDESYQEKIRNGHERKWRFAVPAVRAWRVLDFGGVDVRNVAPLTYEPRLGRVLATYGAWLKPEDRKRALELPVTEVSVFRQRTIPDDEHVPGVASQLILRPSKGLPSYFGQGTVEREDGPTVLYLLKLSGDAHAFLNQTRGPLNGMCIFKLGITQRIYRRCAEMNTGFPRESAFRWSVHFQSTPFANFDSAKAAEDRLKGILKDRTLGDEFFLASEEEAKELVDAAIN